VLVTVPLMGRNPVGKVKLSTELDEVPNGKIIAAANVATSPITRSTIPAVISPDIAGSEVLFSHIVRLTGAYPTVMESYCLGEEIRVAVLERRY